MPRMPHNASASVDDNSAATSDQLVSGCSNRSGERTRAPSQLPAGSDPCTALALPRWGGSKAIASGEAGGHVPSQALQPSCPLRLDKLTCFGRL